MKTWQFVIIVLLLLLYPYIAFRLWGYKVIRDHDKIVGMEDHLYELGWMIEDIQKNCN